MIGGKEKLITEYKNLKIITFVPGSNIDGVLNKPIPCANDYFIPAFWLPIKHQIGEKLVLSLHPNMQRFSLFYNQAATNLDEIPIYSEQIKLIQEDSEKVFDVAMKHIDRIMEHFYCEARTGDVVPFIDEMSPIKSIIDDTITLNGRLPMQEAYFIKKYWRTIAAYHHKETKGVRFKIHFSDLGTKISVSAELCRYNAMCEKESKPKLESSETSDYKLQAILCDIADAVTKAASDYTEACKKNKRY